MVLTGGDPGEVIVTLTASSRVPKAITPVSRRQEFAPSAVKVEEFAVVADAPTTPTPQ